MNKWNNCYFLHWNSVAHNLIKVQTFNLHTTPSPTVITVYVCAISVKSRSIPKIKSAAFVEKTANTNYWCWRNGFNVRSSSKLNFSLKIWAFEARNIMLVKASSFHTMCFLKISFTQPSFSASAFPSERWEFSLKLQRKNKNKTKLKSLKIPRRRNARQWWNIELLWSYSRMICCANISEISTGWFVRLDWNIERYDDEIIK